MSAMEIDPQDNGSCHELEIVLESLNGNAASTISNIVKQISSCRRTVSRKSLTKAVNTHSRSTPAFVKALDGQSIAAIEKPENETVSITLGLVIQIFLLDQKQYEPGMALSKALVHLLKSLNSRKLDPLAARIYFYYAHFGELLGCLQDIRPVLLQCQRTATLRHDKHSLATLITLLLRNHVLLHDITGADKLISKTTFPTTTANATIARYLYYVAKVRAVQLDYTSANEYLTNAIRKVDANPSTAGFLQAVHKLNIIVQLLIGEIPEKRDLEAEYLDRALASYSDLVNAVRKGDLAEFSRVVDHRSEQFRKDDTLSLISRLRNNVLKTGIRSISLSYSRISLKDICLKLGLQSEESAEYIISKAIHENIISAHLNHESAELLSVVPVDIYSSDVPQKGFHERVKFCLELRNKSVRAMRYPEDTGRKAINEIEEERRRIEESFVGDDDDVDEI